MTHLESTKCDNNSTEVRIPELFSEMNRENLPIKEVILIHRCSSKINSQLESGCGLLRKHHSDCNRHCKIRHKHNLLASSREKQVTTTKSWKVTPEAGDLLLWLQSQTVSSLNKVKTLIGLDNFWTQYGMHSRRITKIHKFLFSRLLGATSLVSWPRTELEWIIDCFTLAVTS